MRKNDITEVIKNALIMLAIALIAGIILGIVHSVTKGPIEIMEQAKKKEANSRVFINAYSFEEVPVDTAFVEENLQGVDIGEVLNAQNENGESLGYVIEVISHEGYGGDIVIRVGIQNDGTTNAIAITEISETAGLGMRAPDELVPQFVERNAERFEVVKTGAILDNQINAMSSATITSKAVVGAVNAALDYMHGVLQGGDVNE
ncbi:MAG: FMN-binding protein [Lachnospiraceae bacterium]|nr:FMN-binding protein [Lachnospiraceae bacterium]